MRSLIGSLTETNGFQPVTPVQMKRARELANQRQVGQSMFEKALAEGGPFGRFLDGLKAGADGIMPPRGARIHVVRVKVSHGRNWQEAVDAAGCKVSADSTVKKVGDLYTPIGTREVEEDLIMLNYPDGTGSWDKALSWAEGAGLRNSLPREVFAIGEQKPELQRDLGVDTVSVVATTECIFRPGPYTRCKDLAVDTENAVATTECSSSAGPWACYVWWVESIRQASAEITGGFCGKDDWFVFGRWITDPVPDGA